MNLSFRIYRYLHIQIPCHDTDAYPIGMLCGTPTRVRVRNMLPCNSLPTLRGTPHRVRVRKPMSYVIARQSIPACLSCLLANNRYPSVCSSRYAIDLRLSVMTARYILDNRVSACRALSHNTYVTMLHCPTTIFLLHQLVGPTATNNFDDSVHYNFETIQSTRSRVTIFRQFALLRPIRHYHRAL